MSLLQKNCIAGLRKVPPFPWGIVGLASTGFTLLMKIEYFSTATDQNQHRSWAKMIDEIFGSVNLHGTGSSPFSGEIRRALLGDLEVSEVISDFEISKRTNGHIAADQKENFVLVLLLSGTLNIAQRGQECSLSPGMFALFDLNSPYIYSHVEKTDVLSVKIPHVVLDSRLRNPHRFVATARPAHFGTGRVTADFLRSLAAELERISNDAAYKYAGRIADMISLLFEADDDDLPIENSAVRSAIYRRCVSFIESHSTDPNLTPTKIAECVGISVRYLHKIFQASGESVGDFIRLQRLNRCREELIDACGARVPIKEIAFRAGFHSQSHFATAFKRRYGISPSDLRRSSRI